MDFGFGLWGAFKNGDAILEEPGQSCTFFSPTKASSVLLLYFNTMSSIGISASL